MADPPRDIKLDTPFPQQALKQRAVDGGRRQLTYVEGHTVIHRLNACCPSWDFAIKDISTSVVGADREGRDVVLVRAHVALSIPGLGTREHIGVQAVYASGGEDLVKGAVTDALKKAATLFGVGLELYGPDYEAGEIEIVNRQVVDFAETRGRLQSAYEEDPGPPDFAPPPHQQGKGTGSALLITPKQIKFIQAIAREKGLSEEGLHAQLSRFCPEESSIAALSRARASAFIDHLQSIRAVVSANATFTAEPVAAGAAGNDRWTS